MIKEKMSGLFFFMGAVLNPSLFSSSNDANLRKKSGLVLVSASLNILKPIGCVINFNIR